MLVYLNSKSWPEKIALIEQMNEAGKIARAAMKEPLEITGDLLKNSNSSLKAQGFPIACPLLSLPVPV